MAPPEILMIAVNYLIVGYQKLLTFERPGGGFDWWGSGPPVVWLSAYGLQEFNDMAKVYPIDRGVIDRTQQWLMKQREADGAWSNIGATHSETIAQMGNPKLLLTSYIVWSLADNALAAWDAKDDSTLVLLQKLDKLKVTKPEWKAASFPTRGQSLTYAHGDGLTIETTALAALAMLKSGQFTNSVNEALTYLV